MNEFHSTVAPEDVREGFKSFQEYIVYFPIKIIFYSLFLIFL